MFTKTNALDCEINMKRIEPYDDTPFLIITSGVSFAHNGALNG